MLTATSSDIVRDLVAMGKSFSDHNCLSFSLSDSSSLPRKSKKLVYARTKRQTGIIYNRFFLLRSGIVN